MNNSRIIHDDQNLSEAKWTFEESKLLIAAVKEQPELYDPRNSKYKLLKVTENLWTNFDLLLKKPMGACKDRWAVLRGVFRKEYLEKKDKSRWKLFKSMFFLRKFLYSRGPTLNECIQKAMKDQSKKESSLDDDPDEDRMVTVMSPIMPDGVRNYDEDEEDRENQVPTVSFEKSFTMEYRCDEDQHGDFTFAIPKLEPVEVDDHLQHMSTPIVPPARKQGIKRSLPSGLQIRKVKVQKLSPVEKNSSNEENVIQMGNIKIRKLSATPTGTSQRYSVTQNDDQNGKSVNCSQVNLLNVSTTSNQSNRSVLKPHNYPACSCTADGDMMFMQSLVPDLKKLNSEQRMDFKVQVHQLLHNFLYKVKRK